MARVGVLAVAFGAAVASATAAADGAAAPPSFVQQALPAGSPAAARGRCASGAADLRRPPVGWARNSRRPSFVDYPLALELSYHRAFKGAAIAQRSIDEIERQGELPPAQAQRWLKSLTALLPMCSPATG